MKAPTRNYVDNKKLYLEFVKYKQRCAEAIEAGKERPRLPDSIGKAIYDIATNYVKKKNFSFIHYKDEMVSHAIEVCVKYVHNFDPDRFNNPFSYITLIVHRAFLQWIAKEKKRELDKRKYLKNMATSGALVGPDGIPQGHNYVEYVQKYFEAVEMEDARFLEEREKNAAREADNAEREE